MLPPMTRACPAASVDLFFVRVHQATTRGASTHKREWHAKLPNPGCNDLTHETHSIATRSPCHRPPPLAKIMTLSPERPVMAQRLQSPARYRTNFRRTSRNATPGAPGELRSGPTTSKQLSASCRKVAQEGRTGPNSTEMCLTRPWFNRFGPQFAHIRLILTNLVDVAQMLAQCGQIWPKGSLATTGQKLA